MTFDSVAEAPAQAYALQRERIIRNFAAFESQARKAEAELARGDKASSAVSCAIAAHLATQGHCGIFWSPRVERVLDRLGKQLGVSAAAPRPTAYRRILQVGSQMSPVGGLTKMLAQWVHADANRQHSLVLTQHRGPVQRFIREAFGDRIARLNYQPGGILDWARTLRRMARGYDLVVLHTYCEDVIPLLAFATPGKHPPVLVLNHADHLFWLGSSIAHLNINLRDAAQDLSIARRGIAPERNILMPTLAESVVRTRTRQEAKRELGLSPDAVLLVSVARQSKYRTMHGVTFADIHAPVLERAKDATLLVVGAGDPADWAPVRARFGDRIRPLPETSDPRLYFEAGDIYVDSFPFVSSTSMMEAAGYGMPGVTIFTYPDEARIFGINHVALVGNVLQAASFGQYADILCELIEDPAKRERLGSLSREAVMRDHNMPGWESWLEKVYARAAELPPLDNGDMLSATEAPQIGEPDIRHEDIFGAPRPMTDLIKTYMGALPMPQHLTHWSELHAMHGFASTGEAASYLAPEWLKRCIRDGLLKLPKYG